MFKRRNTASGAYKSRSAQLPIGDIVPDPGQPRKTFATEKLNELTQSLLGAGQISPIVVRPTSAGNYMVVVGERRLRASIEAGLQSVNCIVRDDIDDRKALEMQLAENYQRTDISPIEQARALRNYTETYDVSQHELSRITGIPQRTISARLSLLLLPESVHARLESGEIGPYQALEISKLPPEKRDWLVEEVAQNRLGGRKLEALLKRIKENHDLPIEKMVQKRKFKIKTKIAETYKVNALSNIKSIKIKSVNVYSPQIAATNHYKLNFACGCGVQAAIAVHLACTNCNCEFWWGLEILSARE